MQKRTDILEPTDLDMGLDHEMEEQGPVVRLVETFRKGPMLITQAIDAARMMSRPTDRGPKVVDPDGFIYIHQRKAPTELQQ